MKLLVKILGVGTLFVANTAFAHEVYFECRNQDQATVMCMAGFSDGSDAPNIPVTVFDYNDQEVQKGQTDADSNFIFKRPEGDFYIRLDGGQGHQVEVDHAQIK